VLTWLHGDDNPPPPDVEQTYTAILRENDWPNPFQTSATAQTTKINGQTGYKMTGPYAWVPPAYWLTDRNKGGAFGFIMETSPTAAIPPVESLRRMLAPGHLWPIDDTWKLRSGGGVFKDQSLKLFTDALNARLGPARSLEDYAFKAQLMAYEAQRAMYEAYGQRKYLATGVMHEMLNSAWPSLIWNLYDFYLRPGGAYFGSKKACEPLHVQYAYDDKSVYVVNSLYREFTDLKVTATVYDLYLNQRFARTAVLTASPDSSTKVLTLPDIPDLSTVYFVLLRMEDSQQKVVSSNLYWLSTKPDVLDWDRAEWYVTPAKSYGDFTDLAKLPPVSLKLTSKSDSGSKGEDIMRIQVENPSNYLAFFLRLRVSKGAGGDEILPVVWEDNYFSLMPRESRKVTATYRHRDLGKASPLVEIEGWNVVRSSGSVAQ
jgi:exo-1,4-beta-D-glucosaminidase